MVTTEYIDRRKCRRVVPMQVMCLGLGRTGTESLRMALKHLGYNECYHGTLQAFETPLDGEMWLAALKAKYKGVGKPFGRAEFDQLLGHCRAVSDTPAVCFVPELLEAYPDAKVILNTRADVDAWYNSYLPLVRSGKTPISLFIQLLNELSRSPFRHSYHIYNIIWNDYFRGFEAHGKQVYHEHNAMVRRLVPPERLLEFRADQGWAPLCAFLGHAVPETPYPRINSSQAMAERIQAYFKEQAVIFGRKLAVVVGVAGALWVLKVLVGL